jgi:hypothetical protein
MSGTDVTLRYDEIEGIIRVLSSALTTVVAKEAFTADVTATEKVTDVVYG